MSSNFFYIMEYFVAALASLTNEFEIFGLFPTSLIIANNPDIKELAPSLGH